MSGRCNLTLNTLWADSADDKTNDVFLIFFFHTKYDWTFHVCFSYGDNLHEMSNSSFLGKIREIFHMSSAEMFSQHAK